MTIFTLIGLAGAGAYVVSYVLLQLKKIDGNGAVYTIMNVVAALLVLISLIEQFNLAVLLIQITWIAFGVVGLGSKARKREAAADAAGALNAEREIVIDLRDLTQELPEPAPIQFTRLPPQHEHTLRNLEYHVARLRASKRLPHSV